MMTFFFSSFVDSLVTRYFLIEKFPFTEFTCDVVQMRSVIKMKNAFNKFVKSFLRACICGATQYIRVIIIKKGLCHDTDDDISTV